MNSEVSNKKTIPRGMTKIHFPSMEKSSQTTL